MYSIINTLATTAAVVCMLPAVQAHMAMWHPSMYGFSRGYEPVTPLSNKPFDQWWFHGYINEKPNEVMTLTPGRDVTIEMACSKSYTSWGNSKTGNDACPSDAGSYHAGGSTGSGTGWNGNSEENLTGCALAIAFKSNANDVRPEDFTVMSIQERCVRNRDTSFSIPANLPACPNGECTCAWFWQGKNSADEMYMIGFRCRVEGGVVTTNFPKPSAPKRGGTISGPTQPMYWANTPTNLDYQISWSTKPSYNRAFGWQNGAQTSAFSGSTGNSGTTTGNSGNGNGASSSSSSSSVSSASTTSSRRRPQGTTSSASQTQTGSPEWNEYLAQPSGESSSTTTTSTQAANEGENGGYGGGDATGSPTAAATTMTRGGGRKGHCKSKFRSRHHVAAALS